MLVRCAGHRDEGDAGLDQSPRQQRPLAEAMAAVCVTQPDGLQVNPECPLGPPGMGHTFCHGRAGAGLGGSPVCLVADASDTAILDDLAQKTENGLRTRCPLLAGKRSPAG